MTRSIRSLAGALDAGVLLAVAPAAAESSVGSEIMAAAQRRLAEIEAGLAEAHFAWHGPADGSGAIYYRIQGPTLLIEFSTQDALGAAGGHYHSIYRNPTNEYGRGRAAGPGR